MYTGYIISQRKAEYVIAQESNCFRGMMLVFNGAFDIVFLLSGLLYL